MKADSKSDRRGVREARRSSIQVIERAAVILRALEGERDGLSLGQIALRVGLARSTVQRIVDALSAEHFLMAATPQSGVRLGPAFIRLAASASVEFDQITRPIIGVLSQEVGETVDLSVLKGTIAVFTDQVQGAHRLRAVSAVGQTFPLYCTANGKALLSLLEKDKAERILRLPMSKFTANTITKSTALRRQLQDIRRCGLAYDFEEHTEGISAVGSAFTDPVGRLVAISIPAPSYRFKRHRDRLAKELLMAKRSIQQALGLAAD
jgi:DNA-binding IclR family transcriptional regulator